jgi:energy-coupling factor transporter transmembrane protein EcfT
MHLVLLLTLRVLNSITVTLLLLSTTTFTDVIKALKVFRAPDTMLVIVSLTYKYLLVFAGIVVDMYRAKQARLAGTVTSATARRWIAGRMGFLFRKTQWRCDEIYKAMVARGFAGSVQLVHDHHITTRDGIAAAIGLVCGAGILIL